MLADEKVASVLNFRVSLLFLYRQLIMCVLHSQKEVHTLPSKHVFSSLMPHISIKSSGGTVTVTGISWLALNEIGAEKNRAERSPFGETVNTRHKRWLHRPSEGLQEQQHRRRDSSAAVSENAAIIVIMTK